MRAFPCFPVVLLVSALALAACDTPTERAEQHYQRATELLAAGDADRAMVEFRNVFRLNGAHLAARAQYAALLRDRGDVRGALGQYLRLVELDPGNAAAYRDVTELALRMQDFETAEVNIVQAFKLDPADPMTRALKATLDYRRGEDRPGAVAMAEAVTAEAPEIVPAQMVVIADRLAAERSGGRAGAQRRGAGGGARRRGAASGAPRRPRGARGHGRRSAPSSKP